MTGLYKSPLWSKVLTHQKCEKQKSSCSHIFLESVARWLVVIQISSSVFCWRTENVHDFNLWEEMESFMLFKIASFTKLSCRISLLVLFCVVSLSSTGQFHCHLMYSFMFSIHVIPLFWPKSCEIRFLFLDSNVLAHSEF